MNDTVTSPAGKVLHKGATKNTTLKESAEAKAVRIKLVKNRRLEENMEYLKNRNVKAFLDTIAHAEGGDYDLMYGGIKGKKNDKWRITNYSTHPGAGFDGHTTAAGRYQINKDTWAEKGGQKMGLTDFSPTTQDLIAVEILRGQGSIEPLVQGDLPAAVKGASGRWQALPEGPNLPNRPERGSPSKQPYTKYDDLQNIYTANGGSVAGKK